MEAAFTFESFGSPSTGQAMHLHAYSLDGSDGAISLNLASRQSTDADGIAVALGLQAEAKVELSAITDTIESRLTSATLWTPA